MMKWMVSFFSLWSRIGAPVSYKTWNDADHVKWRWVLMGSRLCVVLL